MFARLIHGVGSALSATFVYSLAASYCEVENLNSTMGYMELAYSLGLTIGPLVASFLYYLNGYSFPFYICAFLMLICFVCISNLEISEEEGEDVNFASIIFNKVYKILN